MQLGMIGLGRMGASMVRRLTRGGHECVVYDVSRKPSRPSCIRAPSGRRRSRTFAQPLAKPRAVWLMVPAAVVDPSWRAWRRCSNLATSSSMAATPTTATTSGAAPS